MMDTAERVDYYVRLKNAIECIKEERARQDRKWGPDRSHPNGTGSPGTKDVADIARMECDNAFRGGWGTWRHILEEEVKEAFAEENPEALAAELIQVAAVCVAWIQDITRESHQ